MLTHPFSFSFGVKNCLVWQFERNAQNNRLVPYFLGAGT